MKQVTTLPETDDAPVYIDRERMNRALAGPRFNVPRGLTREQLLEFFDEFSRVAAYERERCAKMVEEASIMNDWDQKQLAAAIRKGA